MSRAPARLFSFRKAGLLTLRADAEKFQLVADRLELVFGGDAPLNFGRKAFVNLDDSRTFRANQMMVMAVVVLANQFKPRCAVAEVKPFDHAHSFEQVHGPVNCREVTKTLGQRGKNLPAGERMRMRTQNFKNRLTWTGDFARLPVQAAGERGQFLSLVRTEMLMRLHHA